MDAALGITDKLTVMGTNHPTRDGSCIRDFIHVCDLVDAHVKLMDKLHNPPVLFNVGTGRGVSVKEIVNACLKVTQANITVVMQVRRVASPLCGSDPTRHSLPPSLSPSLSLSLSRSLDQMHRLTFFS